MAGRPSRSAPALVGRVRGPERSREAWLAAAAEGNGKNEWHAPRVVRFLQQADAVRPLTAGELAPFLLNAHVRSALSPDLVARGEAAGDLHVEALRCCTDVSTTVEWVGSMGGFDTVEELLEVTVTLRPGSLRLRTWLGAADRRAGAGLRLGPLGVSTPERGSVRVVLADAGVDVAGPERRAFEGDLSDRLLAVGTSILAAVRSAPPEPA